MGRLAGKVALITGAGSGIGRASATLFAHEGARVVCVDIDEATASATVDMVVAEGGEAVAVRADVSSAADSETMVQAAEDTFGGLHVMFNNAGIMHSDDGDAQATSEDVWDLTMNINAKGVFLGRRVRNLGTCCTQMRNKRSRIDDGSTARAPHGRNAELASKEHTLGVDVHREIPHIF